MKLELENKEYIDIKVNRRHVIMEMGVVIPTIDGLSTVTDYEIKFTSLEPALNFLNINSNYYEEIKEYLIENNQYLRILKLKDKINYNFVEYYTDETMHSSNRVKDLITIAVLNIDDKNVNL